jgi:hypothetical protein
MPMKEEEKVYVPGDEDYSPELFESHATGLDVRYGL